MGSVLVTGATGFLGHCLVMRMAALSMPVIAVGRDPEKCATLEQAGIPVIRHDLADPLDETRHPALAGVDAIVHCAALSSPFGRRSAFVRANVSATGNLVALARRLGVRRFVHISTPSLYFGYRDDLDVREDAVLPSPVNAYAATKRQAERIVLSTLPIGPVVLRPRGIYGAGDQSLLPRVLNIARSRPLPLFRDGAARIDLTHVEDVTDAILSALAAGPGIEGGVFNISGGEVLAVTDIVERCCARAGITPRWRRMPLRPALMAAKIVEQAALMLPGAPEPPVTAYSLGLFAYAQSLDISSARRRLGWAPKIRFDEGLERTFAPGAAA